MPDPLQNDGAGPPPTNTARKCSGYTASPRSANMRSNMTATTESKVIPCRSMASFTAAGSNCSWSSTAMPEMTLRSKMDSPPT